MLKKGQKVRVKPYSWYSVNRDVRGNVDVLGFFTEAMSEFLGRIVTISQVWKREPFLFTIVEDEDRYTWSTEMIEDPNSDESVADMDYKVLIKKDIDELSRDELIYLAAVLEEEILTV